MKIVGLMLVKSDSKRLPNKNMLYIGNKPMYMINLEKCLEVFPEVWVSTDSQNIADEASNAGAKIIIRSKELCGDTPNIPVYQHAMEQIECDAFVAVQANSPTVTKDTIQRVKNSMQTYNEVITTHPDGSIYGSVWGISKKKLENYADPYNPTPDITITDSSIDIHTLEDYNKVLNEK